jgi:tetratricopeptide (TPR) repeat protein
MFSYKSGTYDNICSILFNKNLRHGIFSLFKHFLEIWLTCIFKSLLKMDVSAFRRFFYVLVFLPLIIFSGCRSNIKKVLSSDSEIKFTSSDTTIDAPAIVSKANALLSNNKFDQASGLISINLHRFSGKERAMLINARGDVAFVKDDFDNALTDYITATEYDHENSTYLLNVVKSYECVQNIDNATVFAKKILSLDNASDSDRAYAQDIIDKANNAYSTR